MKVCISCGHSIDDTAIFCQYCGARNDNDRTEQSAASECAQSESTVTQETQVQPYSQTQPYQQVQPYSQTQPYQQAQPYSQAQPYRQAQPYQQVQPYPQSQYYASNRRQEEKPLSVGGWIVTLLVMSIPIANIIMMFVWGFGEGDGGNAGRKNFCRAYLIYMLATFIIVFAAVIFLVVVAGLSYSDIATQGSYYYY